MEDNTPTVPTNEVPKPNTQSNITSESTPVPKDKPLENQTVMGILSYLGPLVIIPILLKKNNPFVKFHIKQGLGLLVLYVISYVLGAIIILLYPLTQLVNLGLFVLSIIGIINVIQKKEQNLPLVGLYSDKIEIKF